MSAGKELLEVKDLEVQFHGSRRRAPIRAVNGVSFTIGEGETLGLIGESGSGKSTVGRAVLGLVKTHAGRILLHGRPVWELSRAEQRAARSHVQIIFQNPYEALDPRMTILASTREPLTGPDRSADIARAEEALDRVGLDASFFHRRPHELSGGQRQRVNIARALVSDPELVVCDEVVSALDVSIQAEILNLLQDLKASSRMSYLFISHDLGVVSNVADRVGVMYLGRLAELGPVAAIAERPAHPYTQALLAAEPQVVPSALRPPRPAPLKGTIPSPADPPSGCFFRTRCPLAVKQCAVETPEYRELSTGHWVACHFAGNPSQNPTPHQPSISILEGK